MVHKSGEFVFLAQFEHLDEERSVSVLVYDLDLVQIEVLDETFIGKEGEVSDDQGGALSRLEELVEDLGSGGQQESVHVQVHVVALLVKVLEFEGEVCVVGQNELFREVVGKGVWKVLDDTDVMDSS